MLLLFLFNKQRESLAWELPARLSHRAHAGVLFAKLTVHDGAGNSAAVWMHLFEERVRVCVHMPRKMCTEACGLISITQICSWRSSSTRGQLSTYLFQLKMIIIRSPRCTFLLFLVERWCACSRVAVVIQCSAVIFCHQMTKSATPQKVYERWTFGPSLFFQAIFSPYRKICESALAERPYLGAVGWWIWPQNVKKVTTCGQRVKGNGEWVASAMMESAWWQRCMRWNVPLYDVEVKWAKHLGIWALWQLPTLSWQEGASLDAAATAMMNKIWRAHTVAAHRCSDATRNNISKANKKNKKRETRECVCEIEKLLKIDRMDEDNRDNRVKTWLFKRRHPRKRFSVDFSHCAILQFCSRKVRL